MWENRRLLRFFLLRRLNRNHCVQSSFAASSRTTQTFVCTTRDPRRSLLRMSRRVTGEPISSSPNKPLRLIVHQFVAYLVRNNRGGVRGDFLCTFIPCSPDWTFDVVARTLNLIVGRKHIIIISLRFDGQKLFLAVHLLAEIYDNQEVAHLYNKRPQRGRPNLSQGHGSKHSSWSE